ncbi:terminase TerL endonuclease subunit [Rhizobium sp. Leaf383]|uniref:terminase large subunit n=1 Tax=Rhizobium sp. Leaf383 TaxID=1736357 RepID=UPI000712822D|nr:terminase TerL endonuclease subunit [Rhizobium sp. Leaf383]KQS78093.1 terminase [Rhizobium sp. Leaf383]
MTAHVRQPVGWDLSCVDWEDRIRNGQSLIPDLPLFQEEADLAVEIFDELRLPDVIGQPKMRDACGPWFRGIVRAAFGCYDPSEHVRMIREIFALVPKGQSKTTYSGGLIIVAMLMNRRHNAEMLFIGPTQSVSDRAFLQAAGMIQAAPELYGGPGRSGRFHIVWHEKRIEDLLNGSMMKVKTFALDILTGSMPVVVLLDELHLLGRNPHAAQVMRQIRGGLEKNAEGLLIIITTQSDAPPAGVFRDELITARKIRNGDYRGKLIRAMLPILYEFPDDIASDPFKWQDPENWGMVMPNLGRSMRLHSLVLDWEGERVKGERDIRIWASQHLNIEIGIGIKTDAWPGAEFWDRRIDATLTMKTLMERSEVIVVGIDGGGLDDLFGFAALGREKETRRWLSVSRAWCHEGVLDRRQSIASTLLDFKADGDLTIVDDELKDVSEIIEIIAEINEAGLLACVAIDNEGPYGEFVEELAKIGITPEGGQIEGVGQGYKLMNAIKTTERKLANGTFVHSASRMMDWCIGNIKIEPTATAIRATKQNAGDAKIDPAMALFDAVTVMITNPEADGRSVYEERGLRVA